MIVRAFLPACRRELCLPAGDITPRDGPFEVFGFGAISLVAMKRISLARVAGFAARRRALRYLAFGVAGDPGPYCVRWALLGEGLVPGCRGRPRRPRQYRP